MMKSRAPSPIRFILISLALLVGGYLWFFIVKRPILSVTTKSSSTSSPTLPSKFFPSPESTFASNSFAIPDSLPIGTQISIGGATSMVKINQNLKKAFENKFPRATVITKANGSNIGIQDLLANRVDVAAISRPLNAQEQTQGLRAIPIAIDAIVLVIGINNPFKGKLTSEQAEGIFKGSITNWSQVGGAAQTIRVIHRPAVSGTYQTFKELLLKRGNFSIAPNIRTLKYDATTPLLRDLGKDGIGYATYSQVVNQKTVRSVAINNLLPDHPAYPYKRTLFYVYKHPPSLAVQAFLGYATSASGQKAIFAE